MMALTRTVANNLAKICRNTTIRPITTSRSLYRADIDDIERHDMTVFKQKAVQDEALVKVAVDEQMSVYETSGVPTEHIVKRHARVFMPSRTVTQSGTNQTHKWRVELDNRERWENQLMGWASTADPLSNMVLEFPDADSAAAFCQKNGWCYHIEEPRIKYIKPKSYGANFAWSARTRRTAK